MTSSTRVIHDAGANISPRWGDQIQTPLTQAAKRRLVRSRARTFLFASLCAVLHAGPVDAQVGPRPEQADNPPAADLLEGGFVGLGVELKADKGSLSVMKVIAGSPAQRAGVARGDRIVAIDGRAVAGLSGEQAAQLLQGKEGSFVTLTRITAGQPPRQLRIRRARVAAPKVDVALANVALPNAALDVQVKQYIDPLRQRLPTEVRFFTKVCELTPERATQLDLLGHRIIDRIERSVRASQQVWRPGLVVDINGLPRRLPTTLDEKLLTSPAEVLRGELTGAVEKLWDDAWKKIKAEKGRGEERRKRADIEAQVATLDEALLLSESQRDAIRKLLTLRWTSVWGGRAKESIADPAMLCLSPLRSLELFSNPPVELAVILRPSQLDAFKEMQPPTRQGRLMVRGVQQEVRLEVMQQEELAVALQEAQAPLPRRRIPAQRIVRQAAPNELLLKQQERRLETLLQRLIEGVDANCSLSDEQKQKLLLAGKLDIDRWPQERREPPQQPPAGRQIAVAPPPAVAVSAPLPRVFTDAASMYLKALHGRLTPEQLDKLAANEAARANCRRQAVLQALTVALAQFASLTDDQCDQLQNALARELPPPADIADQPQWGREMLRRLAELRPEAIQPLLDDWQWPAARRHLEQLAAVAIRMAKEPERP